MNEGDAYEAMNEGDGDDGGRLWPSDDDDDDGDDDDDDDDDDDVINLIVIEFRYYLTSYAGKKPTTIAKMFKVI